MQPARQAGEITDQDREQPQADLFQQRQSQRRQRTKRQKGRRQKPRNRQAVKNIGTACNKDEAQGQHAADQRLAALDKSEKPARRALDVEGFPQANHALQLVHYISSPVLPLKL